jgi:hypothetical protein
MSAIGTWSTTAASNNSSPPNGWPEGQAPSSVNNCAREMMAQLKTWYVDAEWINLQYTHTYASATSFTIASTDVTSTYTVGRRIRAVGSSTGTIYGVITASVFSTNTTVTVHWDSGSLSSEALTVSISEIMGGTASSVSHVPAINDGPLAGFRNRLINPTFAINNRAAATNADDTYSHDRWYALTQTNTIAVTTVSDPENTTLSMARLTQSQAVAQRMGYAQIIESANCRDLRGKPTVLKARIRCSSSQAIRYAILEWTGTADAVTSDVVNDWTSSTYTANNFFLAASLTITAVGSITPAANTLTDLTALIGTLGSSVNNVIVFIWTEGTAAQNVTLDIGKAQYEHGVVASRFEIRPIGLEQDLCERYLPFFQSDSTVSPVGSAYANTTTAAIGVFPFRVRPRIAPTGLTVSAASHFSLNINNGNVALVTLALGGANLHAAYLSLGNTGYTAAAGALMFANSTSGQLLFTGCEL